MTSYPELIDKALRRAGIFTLTARHLSDAVSSFLGGAALRKLCVCWMGGLLGILLCQNVQANTAPKAPGVVVVLAGGGAKGFSHLAVLRRLEKDGVKISRIVATSMGAVIGGLYASGMSTDDIEHVIGNLDPAKVALDQLDRLELPQRTRAYQQQYPIDFEFGIQNGGLSFARGVSDGQRFLALLQKLTANVPSQVSFDDLKIPFRAVATRYRDGEPTVFDKGSLYLSIRASMAAPAVFAPVEIEGETYVDGGLVANLPVEIALKEGADVVVASFLGQDTEESSGPSNALTVANRMLDILIRQNEKRNLSLLRAQDILVQPALAQVGFADFGKAAQISLLGEQAVQKVNPQFVQLARRVGSDRPIEYSRLVHDQREVVVQEIRVKGNKDVPTSYIQSAMSPLLGKDLSQADVAKLVDQLYTSGHFERVNYTLEQIKGGHYAMVVDVNEKPYGPNFIKTSFGFSTELGGVTQFSLGAGYRRPWVNQSGLELAINGRLGTQSELSMRLHQPLWRDLSAEAYALYERNIQPIYAPDSLVTKSKNEKFAFVGMSTRELGVDLAYDLGRMATLKMGVVTSTINGASETSDKIYVESVSGQSGLINLSDLRVAYTGLRFQLLVDQLDSVSFPSRGYLLNTRMEQGLSGASFRSYKASGRWAYSLHSHILNAGVNLGYIKYPDALADDVSPSSLYLGGFQQMGAYRMGQLMGDRLAHFYGTYMYRLSDGGLLRQKTYLGTVLEGGDVWTAPDKAKLRRSATVFLAVDSKIGDIYFGLARGSQGAANAFVQLGRRFNF
ncbi:MAG: patatin-like phospholipase family protein [Betaproteobacteria bacterium]|nr:patatin-like phospholipase family protein [Betaproteobacteria bacterium]